MATIQEQFRAAVKKADQIKAGAEAKGGFTPEDTAAFNEAVKAAQGFRKQIEDDQVLSGLKSWGAESAGSVVNGGFVGEVVFPDEGNIPGVTEDPHSRELIVNEDKGIPSEYKSLGEKKLKVLKSGAYKDAYVDYIRAKGLGNSMKASAMKVLQEGVDTGGGFWIPPDIRSELVKKEATIAGVSNDVNSFAIGSNMVTFPKLVYTTDDNYTSGAKPAWSVEYPTSAPSEATNPVSGLVEITVYLLTASILMTRSMLEDNLFDLLGFITNILGENFPLFKNNAFINGDGVGKPTGFLNHALATTLYSTAGGGMKVFSGVSNSMAWGTETGLDPSANGILGTEANLPPQYENGAKWYGKKQTYSVVRGMTDGNGRPMWQIYDGYAPYVNGLPATLLGYPIVKDQFMPAVGDGKYPLAFGQMKGYYAPNRVGLSVEVFRETYAAQDLVLIYARQRLGGKLVEEYRMKLLKSDDA